MIRLSKKTISSSIEDKIEMVDPHNKRSEEQYWEIRLMSKTYIEDLYWFGFFRIKVSPETTDKSTYILADRWVFETSFFFFFKKS